MNPQVLIDGVAHGVRSAILLLDKRRKAAISQLQWAQYGADFRTSDSMAVGCVRMTSSVERVKAPSAGSDRESLLRALEEAFDYPGSSPEPRARLLRRQPQWRNGGLRPVERRQLVRRRAGLLHPHVDLRGLVSGRSACRTPGWSPFRVEI